MATTYSIFSLGLIGGSIAKAIKQEEPDSIINIYARRQETIDEAKKAGVCDYGTTTIEPDICKADYLFLCAPVSANVKMLETIKLHLGNDTIITDVGSVKSDIHEHIDALGLSSHFIGGHPMAGSEKTGFAYSSAKILENAYYVLTPGEGVSPDWVTRYENLVKKMHAIPIVLDYKDHDYATAGISHLPHVIAYSLANLIRQKDNNEELMKMLAAGGFRDITRVAASSPDMWEQICLTNTDNILSLLDDYMGILEEMKTLIRSKDGDALNKSFQEAKNYRDSFNAKFSGPLQETYYFNIDLEDIPGAIAHVSTILALHQINIKNIGIAHNREFEEGALRVEFYDKDSMNHAKRLLISNELVVYDAK